MATLPVIGARPTPNPQRGIASDRSGEVVANAIVGIGQVVGRIGDEYQRETDAQAVFAARRKLDEWERIAIYDPKGGAINKLGKDALDLPEKMPAQFDEFAGKVAGELTTARQKQAFQEMAQSRRGQVLDWTNRHALQQREVYDKGQFEADLSSMRERAAMFADDPAKVAGELATSTARIVGYMRGKGLSEEQTQAAIREQSSRTHAAVLESMIQGEKWDKASGYLADNRNQIDAGVASKATAAIKTGSARLQAQVFGDEAVTKGLTLQDALNEARAKFSGKDEDEAIREVKERFTEAEVIRNQSAKKVADAAWTEVMQSGRVAPTTLATLRLASPETERQIRDWQDAKRRRAKSDAEGRAPKTDWKTYIDVREKLASGQTVDLRQYTPSIAPAQLEQLLDIQTKRKDAKKAPEVASSEQQIGAMTKVLELNGERLGQFQSAAYDRFNMWLTKTGKEPDYDDRQKILDQLTQDVVTDKGLIWDSKAPAYQAKRELRNAIPLPWVDPLRRVNSVEEARALPKGTRFIDANGVERIR